MITTKRADVSIGRCAHRFLLSVLVLVVFLVLLAAARNDHKSHLDRTEDDNRIHQSHENNHTAHSHHPLHGKGNNTNNTSSPIGVTPLTYLANYSITVNLPKWGVEDWLKLVASLIGMVLLWLITVWQCLLLKEESIRSVALSKEHILYDARYRENMDSFLNRESMSSIWVPGSALKIRGNQSNLNFSSTPLQNSVLRLESNQGKSSRANLNACFDDALSPIRPRDTI